MKRIAILSLATVILSGTAYCNAEFPQQEQQAPVMSDASSVSADNIHTGYFVEGGVGTMMANIDDLDQGDFQSISGGFGGILSLGYLFTPHFALEMDGLYAGVNGQLDDTGAKADGTFYMIGPGIKLMATLGDRFILSFKLGAAYTHLGSTVKDGDQQGDGKASFVLPYDALGLSYAVSPQASVGVSYQGLLYGVVNVGVVSANVTYHFS